MRLLPDRKIRKACQLQRLKGEVRKNKLPNARQKANRLK